jgi:hypothetical protein
MLYFIAVQTAKWMENSEHNPKNNYKFLCGKLSKSTAVVNKVGKWWRKQWQITVSQPARGDRNL